MHFISFFSYFQTRQASGVQGIVEIRAYHPALMHPRPPLLREGAKMRGLHLACLLTATERCTKGWRYSKKHSRGLWPSWLEKEPISGWRYSNQKINELCTQAFLLTNISQYMFIIIFFLFLHIVCIVYSYSFLSRTSWSCQGL